MLWMIICLALGYVLGLFTVLAYILYQKRKMVGRMNELQSTFLEGFEDDFKGDNDG